MDIKCPTLGICEAASTTVIESLIPDLEEKEDPYAILSKSEFTYMQTLWTKDGYVLEYQENDVVHHYESRFLLGSDEIIAVFLEYFEGFDHWKEKIEFNKKSTRSVPNQIGFWIGRFFRPVGCFFGGFKSGYNAVRKKS